MAFRTRNFASLLTAACGLVLAVSGTVLYVVPEGRVAYWTDWRLAGLAKEQWGAMHTVLGLVFLAAATGHALYNGRALLAYLRDRLTLRPESTAALLLTVLCVAGSAAEVEPFATVTRLGKAAKQAWYRGEDVRPPFPHAELMPLRQLTGKLDLSLEGALAYLHEHGHADAGAGSTLKGLTAGSDASPAMLFEAMMLDDRLYR